MPIETYPGNVGSSPAKVQKPHTYDPTRQGLEDQRSLKQHREDDMDDCIDTTIIMTPNQFKDYVPVPPDFDTVFPEERIREIAAAFQQGFAAIARRPDPEDDKEKDAAGMLKPLERDITKLWAEISKQFNLFPGYFFHSSETTPDAGDTTRLRIDASLISNSDKEDVVGKGPNWPLARLGVELKPGLRKYDAFEKREDRPAETQTKSRRNVRGQTMSYAKHTFAYQHRTKLFQLLINGKEYRAMRWDRSGVIVTDNVNYVDDIAGTRLLLEFLYGFSQLSDSAQGLDHTVVRVKRGTCAWMRMEVLAFYHGDVSSDERDVSADEFPHNFAWPDKTANAPTSPLFNHGLLHHDPCAECHPQSDHISTTIGPDPLPVWKHMRDMFRQSLEPHWPRYQITLGGRKYLVAKPLFEASGMVSRATRGYVALDWLTQRFVFLKDAWRPYYVDVDREGDVLAKLNKNEILYVPTLIAHEDVREVGGAEQETETSRFSPNASKKLKKTVKRTDKTADSSSTTERTIAPIPSRKRNTSSKNKSASPTSADNEQRAPASSVSKPGKPTGIVSEGGAPRPTRGVKRSAMDVDAEGRAQDGSGLRHLTHYRIVVSEVCLPSTAFTYGRQWARIILHCLWAHQGAYEKCGIIHRDISVGNILIMPHYITADGMQTVMYLGVLCDWELGKKHELNNARQPERTGTWQFMSVRCLGDPTLPVLLPDELESFTHSFLYNSLRFLIHNCKNIDRFINDYFDDNTVDTDYNTTAPHAKLTSINAGKLLIGNAEVIFSDRSNKSHPLNELYADLMTRFRARYNILRWKKAQAAQKDTRPSVISSASRATTVEDRGFLGIRPKVDSKPHPTPVLNAEPKPHAPATVTKPATAVAAPTEEDIKLAQSLTTHETIIELFVNSISRMDVWPGPGEDMVGYDRLHGYQARPRANTRDVSKPSKQPRTMPADNAAARPASSSSHGPGGQAARDRGRGRGRGAATTVPGLVS